VTNSSRGPKPLKPYAGFPLFAHASGRWCKKIKQKFHYFGKWDDPEGALQRYLDQRDDLFAGRTPRVQGDGLTVADLCNRFLTSKKHTLDIGEITGRYFRDLHTTCSRLVNVFGKTRLVTDLDTSDFERLRDTMAETMGPVARKTEIQKTRGIFKYGYDAALIDRPVRYGPSFKSPSRRVLQKARRANGCRMFEPDELHKMLDAATPHFRAMILLGVNCGFGNHDVATLTFSALDLDAGWVDHPRPKTGVDRRCPLWPATVQAIREAIAGRRQPKDPAYADRVFVTAAGNPWVYLRGSGWNDAVGTVCRELLIRLGLKRLGRNFYGLRHTFRTVADETRDQPAIDLIMGHTDPSMGAVYRERIGDDRLQAVVDHVRGWLFGKILRQDNGTE